MEAAGRSLDSGKGAGVVGKITRTTDRGCANYPKRIKDSIFTRGEYENFFHRVTAEAL